MEKENISKRIRQLEKHTRRLTEQIKILINNPKFIDDIVGLRKKWSIPNEGLKTNDGWKKWQKWLENESEDFTKKNILIKLKENPKNKAEFLNLIPINAFNLDLDNLLKKYKLPPDLKNSIRYYLLADDMENMMLSSGISISLKYDKEGVLKKIIPNIGANTTLEDIKAIWGQVKSYQKKLPYKRQEKLQPIPNLDRDLFILNLKKEGKSYEEIIDTIRNEYDVYLSHDEIYKIIQRLKKRMDIS